MKERDYLGWVCRASESRIEPKGEKTKTTILEAPVYL
jgi:hypothetical protein